jgi:hypothetical protein
MYNVGRARAHHLVVGCRSPSACASLRARGRVSTSAGSGSGSGACTSIWWCRNSTCISDQSISSPWHCIFWSLRHTMPCLLLQRINSRGRAGSPEQCDLRKIWLETTAIDEVSGNWMCCHAAYSGEPSYRLPVLYDAQLPLSVVSVIVHCTPLHLEYLYRTVDMHRCRTVRPWQHGWCISTTRPTEYGTNSYSFRYTV